MHFILSLVFVVAGAWAAWCTSIVLLPNASSALRISSWLATGFWMSVVAFELLSPIHMFATSATLAVCLVGAAVAHASARVHRPWHRWCLLTDAIRIPGSLHRAPLAAVVVLAAFGVVSVHVFRGMFAPSLAWDDLTYHLYRAARWLQTGGFSIQSGANAWGYSEFFSPVGDIVWTWSMLPVRDDSLVVLGNVALLGAAVVSIYAAARQLGAGDRTAMLASIAAITTPSVLQYVPSGYVEGSTFALFALSVCFLAAAVVCGVNGAIVLFAGMLGLALGVKVSNLAFVALGAILLVARTRRIGPAYAALSVAALLIPAAFVVKTWLDTGSPSYPIPVEIAGKAVFDGNFWQQQIFSGGMSTGNDTWSALLTNLFVPTAAGYDSVGQFINLGPGVALLTLAAVAALRSVWRSRPNRMVLIYLVGAAILVFVSAMDASVVNLRTVLGTSFGRFLGVPVVTTAVLAATWKSSWADQILMLAIAVNCVLAFPLGWCPADATAAQAFAFRSLPVLIGGAGVTWVVWRRARPFALVVGAATVLLAVFIVSPVRSRLRYDYFKYAAEGKAFTVSRDVAMIAVNWQAWRNLDRQEPLRIAVTGGWPSMSPLGPRYPFMGSRLQNTVVYVPITQSGDVSDSPQSYAAVEEGVYSAWARRLAEQRVDYLVILTHAIEGLWVREHQDAFHLESDISGVETYRVLPQYLLSRPN